MSATTSQPAQVNVSESDPQVVLRPENNDLFIRTGKQVIDACNLGVSLDLWFHELRALEHYVREWAANRADQVESIYVAPRGRKLILFVQPVSKIFDFDLADEMAILNAHLAKTFNTGPVELLQVPLAELDRFVDLTQTQLLYGKQTEPRRTVEAQS